MLKIIITIDYEIFGNGSGNIRQCLIDPTHHILAIADKYKVPITLMVDFCEYNAFEKEENNSNFSEKYTPATWIRDQLINVIKTGHDIQLHVHPQWINYSYNKETNKWNLDFNHWRTSSLSYDQAYDLFTHGKAKFEELFRKFKPDYNCIAFRAGAWSIQPEKHILRALIDSGLKIDSTVVPGHYYNDNISYYNFRDMPSEPFWNVTDNLRKKTTNGIIEVPIFTTQYSLSKKIYFKLLKAGQKADIEHKTEIPLNPMEKMRYFLRFLLNSHRSLDICSLTDKEMIAMLSEAEKRYLNTRYKVVPVVAIGHSKTFRNSVNFENFIRTAVSKKYQFATFTDISSDLST